MTPPTSIDGTDITSATIDGQEVQEITVDGDTVFTAGPDIPDSAVLRYNFEDDTATDVWNDFNGTLEGPTHQPAGGPDGSGAFDFDGENDYIRVPDAAVFEYSSAGAVSFYVLLELDSLDSDYFIFATDGNNIILYMDTGGGADGYRGGSSAARTGADIHGATTNYQTVVLTIDDNNTKLYTDGSLVDSVSDGDVPSSGGFEIGRDGGGDRYFEGEMADFRIYDKVLTDTEVSNLHSTGQIDGV